MHYIEEAIRGEVSENIHRRFVRYSRGEFDGAVIKIKKEDKTLKINATEDYVESIGLVLARNSKNTIEFSGKILSREDLTEKLREHNVEIKKSGKKKGLYWIQLSGNLTGEKLAKIYEALHGEHVLLDASTGEDTLKTKKILPKPGSGIDERFCSANINASMTKPLIEEICSDKIPEEFSELKISHRYIVKELIVPEEYKSDYATARIKAKRKGIIKRTIEADGEKKEIEHEFIA